MRAIARGLRGVRGVVVAKANTLTGSLVIHYDVDVVDVTSIRTRLESGGFDVICDMHQPLAPRLAHHSLGYRIADSAVQAILERLAVALLAALIH